ncbi:MAG: MFS transporter, partial [Dongiaceae bacterium]
AVLNGGRALQGVGAALQLSAALATLSHAFRGAARARAFAFWGSVIGIAISLGPIAGGFITQAFGWRWAFYVNLPIGIVMLVLTAYALRDSKDPEAGKIDLPGFLTFSSSLFIITFALITGNRQGWDSPRILAEFAAAAVLFGLFLVVETLQKRPMLDLGFFRRPTYIGANIAGLAYAAGLLTMLTYLPLYFQSGLGYRPQAAGLLMLPMALPLFIVPRIVATHLTHRFTGRALLAAGLALIAIGLLWMGIEAPGFNYLAMLGGMFVAGIGAGILNGETAKVSMTVIPPERAGMASGMSGTVRFSGIVVGFAALGAVLYGRVGATVTAGLPAGTAVDRLGFIHRIAAGDLSGGDLSGGDLSGGNLSATVASLASPAFYQHLAASSFGNGYQAILLVAAILAGLSAVLTWLLVHPGETAPMPHHRAAVAVPVE